MTHDKWSQGQLSLTLSVIGLAMIALEGLAMALPCLFVLPFVGTALCGLIPVVATLEVLAIIFGIIHAQSRSGKVGVGIACLSLGMLVPILLWFGTSHTIDGP